MEALQNRRAFLRDYVVTAKVKVSCALRLDSVALLVCPVQGDAQSVFNWLRCFIRQKTVDVHEVNNCIISFSELSVLRYSTEREGAWFPRAEQGAAGCCAGIPGQARRAASGQRSIGRCRRRGRGGVRLSLVATQDTLPTGKCWQMLGLHACQCSTAYTLTPPTWVCTRVQLLCYTATVVQVQGPGYIDMLA